MKDNNFYFSATFLCIICDFLHVPVLQRSFMTTVFCLKFLVIGFSYWFSIPLLKKEGQDVIFAEEDLIRVLKIWYHLKKDSPTMIFTGYIL